MKKENVCRFNKKSRRRCAAFLFAFFVGVGVVGTFESAASAQAPRDGGASSREPGSSRPDRRGRGDRRPSENGAENNGAQQPEQPSGGPRPGMPAGESKPNEPPQISLDEALASGAPTAPILLNQSVFTSQDGVQLVANFYKGRADSDAVPVVLLHDRDGKKEQYDALAKSLAAQGCAVLVPDLRGCGASTSRSVNDFSRGNIPMRRKSAEYLMKNFTNDDLRAAVEYDKLVWFNFLLYLHNKEMLNVKKTIIVGAGLGAALGSAWAKTDWLGKEDYDQNVVGLALLSPDASNDEGKFNALPAIEAIRKKAKGSLFGFVVFVGSMTETKFNDAKEIQKKIGGKKDEELPPEEKVVPVVALKTESQGMDLLSIQAFGVGQTLQQFIAGRIQKLPKKRQEWEEIKLD